MYRGGPFDGTEKGPLDGTEMGCLDGTAVRFSANFISEKGCLEGTSEIFEENKVQREKWPVPSNGPPCIRES